jgi:DNA-binding beta-propeller fold protein YncE
MRFLMIVLVLFAACAASPTAPAPTATNRAPAAAPKRVRYLVVTKQTARTVRIIRESDASGSDLDVGVTTQSATTDGDTAFLIAPYAGELVMVSGWPPKVRVVHGLRRPHDAAIAGSRVAVTEENANDLALIDPVRGRVTERVALPGRPHNVVTSPDGFLVTIPNRRSLVDVRNGRVQREVQLGERPHACVPYASAVWCVTYDAPYLLKVENGRVTRHITFGVYPHHLTVARDGSLFVSDPVGGTVFDINPDGRIVRRFAVPRAEHLTEHTGELDVVSDLGWVYRFRNGSLLGRWSEPGKPHAIVEVAARPLTAATRVIRSAGRDWRSEVGLTTGERRRDRWPNAWAPRRSGDDRRRRWS